MITATPAHADACAAIHAAAFPAAEAWSAFAFAELLALPGMLGLIDPAGGLVLVRRAADEAEIITVATAPPARRCGTARALVQAAIAWAAQGGATRVFLEVAEANAAARALYGAEGFVLCGRRRGYYPAGRDALVLQFSLGE